MIKKNNLLQTNDKEVKELKDAIESFNKHNFFNGAVINVAKVYAYYA